MHFSLVLFLSYFPQEPIRWSLHVHVNPFPRKFINRTTFFCNAWIAWMRLLPAVWSNTILLSFLYFHWLFPLLARKTSSGNYSIYKSTRERVDSNGSYGRWRLHLMGSWPSLFPWEMNKQQAASAFMRFKYYKRKWVRWDLEVLLGPFRQGNCKSWPVECNKYLLIDYCPWRTHAVCVPLVPWIRPAPGGRYTQKNWVMECGPLPKTLTLFMTWPKIWYSIYDLTLKSTPCFGPALKLFPQFRPMLKAMFNGERKAKRGWKARDMIKK